MFNFKRRSKVAGLAALATTIFLVATACGGRATPTVTPVLPTATAVVPSGNTGSAGNTSGTASTGATGATGATTVPSVIHVLPGTISIEAGASRQLIADVRDANGYIVNVSPSWAIVGGGGSIDSTGWFTAGNTPGTSTVRATVGAVSGQSTVTVASVPLATISLTPAMVMVVEGTTWSFSASAMDANGNPVPLTPAWSVVGDNGTISADGRFTAGSAGTYTITASSGSVTGYASATVVSVSPVTVTPGEPGDPDWAGDGVLYIVTASPDSGALAPGATRQLIASAWYTDADIRTVTPQWSVSPGGGTITNTGMYTAGNVPGEYTVTANFDSVFGSATTTVVVGFTS